MDVQAEIARTHPDFVVYVPRHDATDTGNEHFLVFDGPDGSLMAVWTQSTFEGMPDQHIVFSRSTDEGEYVFLLHNHDGHFQSWGPTDTSWHRRPILVS